ncbi:MAG: nucleoside triphosphate pyrophosphohydrolase [Pseudomonadota bacterium]
MSSIQKLIDVMAALRNPKSGCPWDLEQTYQTIMPHTLEEAYEVADAIEREDMSDLKDELGDLLFQVIYYAQIASEDGYFTFEDIAKDSAQKMISRHPHVFGDQNAKNAEDVNDIWDQQKDKEKKESGISSVTKGLPALLRAHKIQKKAAKVGYEWPSSSLAFDKLKEEIQEFEEASTLEHKEEELGDLLFCIVNYARMEGINSEEALRKANDKFIKRFSQMETLIKKDHKSMSDLNVDEMLDYWKIVKAA